MVIQHNIQAMNANRQLNTVSQNKASHAEKLSSGYQINRSADDAAGLSISEKMRKQIRGLDRGITNTEDGISLCQVADGALAEVHDMLQRINELAVQAANGTNSATDRGYINDEVSALLDEIDRIGETTEFNDIKIFKGLTTEIIEHYYAVAPNGDLIDIDPPTIIPSMGFDSISMDCELTAGPFNAGSAAQTLKIAAKGTDGDTTHTWNLIYGNGSTSTTSIRGTYTDATGSTQRFQYSLQSSTNANDTAPLTRGNYQAVEENGVQKWSRDFTGTDANGLNITIRQTVALHPKTTDSQYYTISYDIINNSSFEIDFDFMQHEDIAYNNNDYCESYFLDNGDKVERVSMYTTNPEYTAITGNPDIHSGVPSNFSIVDVDEALNFTQNIQLNANNGGVTADTVVFGYYSSIYQWNRYTESGLDTLLGSGTDNRDMGISLIWSNQTLSAGNASQTLSFQQGIKSTDADTNMPPNLKKAENIVIPSSVAGSHYYIKKEVPTGDRTFWIQSGAEARDGITLEIGPLSTTVLKIDTLSVATQANAEKALDQIGAAINAISSQRSRIGAYQNRLEHTIKNEENIVENTTASESQIRDTDMAEEMVQFSNTNILEQAGQSMLAQANQANQGLLGLLQ